MFIYMLSKRGRWICGSRKLLKGKSVAGGPRVYVRLVKRLKNAIDGMRMCGYYILRSGISFVCILFSRRS
jgi:hypothetical protein